MPQVPEGWRRPDWADEIESSYQDWKARGSQQGLAPAPGEPAQLPVTPDAQAWMYAGWQAAWFTLWSRVRVELGYDVRPAGSDGAEAGRGPQAA